MRRDDVIRLLREHWDEIRQHSVKHLSLFGSVARDEAGPDSDVDVLVEFDTPIGLIKFVHVKHVLEDLLGRPVDLVTLAGLRSWARPSVERDAIHVA